MSYQEEEQAKQKRHLSKQAIAFAGQGKWQEAVAANKDIISGFPREVDAYNRLGKAYMELGEYSLAIEAYQQAAAIDPYNIIAKKNLARLSRLGEGVAVAEGGSHKAEPQHFIEEIGRSGIVSLLNLAKPRVLARMVAGDRVYLKVAGTRLLVENGRGEYLGEVDPRYGRRLVRLMAGGNEYSAAITSAAEDRISVIIREVFQHPSQAGLPSFLSRGFEKSRPYVSDRLLRYGLEYGGDLVDEPSYTIISGGGEGEDEETDEEDDDSDDNEE